MATLKLQILWTRLGDATPHQHLRTLSVQTPIDRETTPLEDALLALPLKERDGQRRNTTYTVKLVKPRDELTENVVLEQAVPQALRQIEMVKRTQGVRVEEAKRIDSQRANEIRVWTKDHGSPRLRRQLETGLSGWPLYLHERLAQELPRCELDNDGEHGIPLINPTTEQLGVALQIAIRAIELWLCADGEGAHKLIEIVPIRFYDWDDLRKGGVYVTFAGYRPGSEAFDAKTIRFRCEE